jgi:hypothetical protein
MLGGWDRQVRRILEVAGDDRSELLHRLLLALGEHENGLDALNAALDGFGAARSRCSWQVQIW